MTTTAYRRTRRRLSQLMTMAGALVLVAGLAFVWVRVVETLRAPPPPSASHLIGTPGGLVWDGRVFTSPAQLRAFLGPRAFARWEVRHPTAFGAPAVSTPSTKTKPPAKTKTTPKATPAKTTPTATTSGPVSAAPVTTTASRSLLPKLLTLLLVLVGSALGLSALVPPRLAPLPLRRLYAHPDRRSVALAAATAMVLGFGVAFYLS
jgi:hypothetical protein